jgi:mono/diheme cytochrome c family protein
MRRIGGFAVLSWLIVAVPLGAQTRSFDSALVLRVSTVERFAQDRPLGAATSRDVAAGQQIFDAQCAWCNGAAGTGGTGPDLRRSTLRHATNDLTLVEIVRNGIPGTEMPSFAISLTYAKQTWAKGLDARGRPIEIPGMEPSEKGTLVYPSLQGSTN